MASSHTLSSMVGLTQTSTLRVLIVPTYTGPINPLKFGTLVSRATENIVRKSELFFRTSPTARSHPRFLDENRLLPPLAFETVVEALKALMREGLPIELYFADEEGDPYAVELAGKLNGYVIGTDSDFVILNAEGYKGYIPLDDVIWDAPVPENPASQSGRSGQGPSHGFQQMKRGKATKSPEVDHGIIPPAGDVSQISLTCLVTSPALLASHLHLPVSHLPLLGALVGNDFSTSPSTGFGKISPFFDKGVSLSQRIILVSNTIRNASQNPTRKNTKKPEGHDKITDLTRRVVHTLLSQGTRTPTLIGESKIIEITVKSALQYALPAREGSALRPPGPSCLLLNPGDVYPHGRDIGKIVRRKYLDGYRIGNVPYDVLNPLNTGTMWARPFLEDPQKETVQCSIGRPIREWVYAILDDGVGLSVRPERETSKAERKVGRGGEVSKRRVIAEYVRRGPNFGPEAVGIGSLSELLEELGIPLEGPIQLEPDSTRLRLLFAIIGAEEVAEKLRKIPPEHILPALAVRWVVSVLYDREMESGGDKDQVAEKWTRSEVKALLLAFIRPTTGTSRAAPEIRDRHVQLTAQILASVDAIILLAQALLLDLDRCMPLNLVARFSGKKFHQLLNNGRVGESSKAINRLMDVATTGIDADAFGDGVQVGKEQPKQKTLPTVEVGKVQPDQKAPPRSPPRRGSSSRGSGLGFSRKATSGFFADFRVNQ